MTYQEPTLYKSVNARFLLPEEVAATFVPPGQVFTTLALSDHTLVIGPRGSGKTTLLKMLHPRALDAWTHELAEEITPQIDYTGVFIPTDISWSTTARTMTSAGVPESVAEHFVSAMFTLFVVQCFISSVRERIRFSPAQEAELVSEVSHALELKPVTPSLHSVETALASERTRMQRLAIVESLIGPSGRSDRIAGMPHLGRDPLQTISVVLTSLDGLLDRPTGKWALLFDELELAPRPIRDQLTASLRSIDSRLLLKLSMAPYLAHGVERDSGQDATPIDDFEEVHLTYGYKQNAVEFSRELFKSLVHARSGQSLDPRELLGSSDFESEVDVDDTSGTYRPGGRAQKQFASLASKDATFRAYLEQHGVALDELAHGAPSERASDIRKVRSLVTVRSEFRKSDDDWAHGETRLRSRKVYTHVYAGADGLFAMLEGNPRWLLVVLNQLLIEGEGRRGLSKNVQMKHVQRLANRFRALLRTIPVGDVQLAQSRRGVLTLVDQLGEFFRDAVIADDFSDDPPLAFYVDSHTPEGLLVTIGRALNAGALVYVPESGDQSIVSSLKGKRFRLAYLLAPQYRLPLRIGRAVSLSRILEPGAFEGGQTRLDLSGGGQ